MHDIHRDSIFNKKKHPSKNGPGSHGHHEHYRDQQQMPNNMDVYKGHDHSHNDRAYCGHDNDPHIHSHDHLEDRAWSHVHEHAHVFYHQHHHLHDANQTGIIHRLFMDPVRDWFAVTLMALLISAGYFRLLPGYLSDGIIVCAAVIGIYPLFKNALSDCIKRKKPSFELLLSVLLFAGLLSGMFLEVALACLLLLTGSFMKLNFAWKRD